MGLPVLPLNSSVKTVAVIGPLADDGAQMIGSWGGKGTEKDVATLRGGFGSAHETERAADVLYAKGTAILGNLASRLCEAVNAARQADVVVMALGEDAAQMTGEAGSRAHLDLPGNQQQLLEAVTATGKPIVLLRLQRASVGAQMGGGTRAGDHGSVVPRRAGRSRNGAYALRRCVAQRQAHHQLPSRCRPGAALLQRAEHRTPSGKS